MINHVNIINDKIKKNPGNNTFIAQSIPFLYIKLSHDYISNWLGGSIKTDNHINNCKKK